VVVTSIDLEVSVCYNFGILAFCKLFQDWFSFVVIQIADSSKVVCTDLFQATHLSDFLLRINLGRNLILNHS
jgi:hypothetical protein